MLETTRLGIEVKNLKMRVESMSSRLDFDERRARALEGVVQYRPGTVAPLQPPAGREPAAAAAGRGRQRHDVGGRSRAAIAAGAAGADGRRPGGPGRRRPGQAAVRRVRTRAAAKPANASGASGETGGGPAGVVKLAVVAQRYGADINGGAELHARYIAERLARHAEVEVVTTCARDYVSWRNELPPGLEHVNGVPVRRFPVDPSATRSTSAGARARSSSRRIHSPTSSRGSIAKARRARRSSTICAVGGDVRLRPPLQLSLLPRLARRAAARRHKAMLVPTAERDPAIGLSIFGPIFRSVARIMYNSHEERAMIQGATGNEHVPASSSASAPTSRREPMPRASGGKHNIKRRLRSTSDGSTRTRAASSSSTTSSATP